jgi:stearoyl-CoA desaturase (Delta-9 desaturase)
MTVDLLPEPVLVLRRADEGEPGAELPPSPVGLAQAVTAAIIVAPMVAFGYAVVRWWGHGVGIRDLVLIGLFYIVVGHGVTVGFHRLLTHRSFSASRPLKIALGILGSMAFQGGPIGWVADHRRHHAMSDRDGDPHSPHGYGPTWAGQLRGLWHAHMGWLLHHAPTSARRYAGDMLRDRDLVVVDALFPVWCLASLALPFGVGWVFGGVAGGLTALLWAGGVRIFLLHHVTWSINSICHTIGRRPFATNDRSTNVGALALVSLGESWHNGHHAFPRSARHGVLRHQVDSSALLIALFERIGWAKDVHWRRAGSVDSEAAHRAVGAG